MYVQFDKDYFDIGALEPEISHEPDWDASMPEEVEVATIRTFGGTERMVIVRVPPCVTIPTKPVLRWRSTLGHDT